MANGAGPVGPPTRATGANRQDANALEVFGAAADVIEKGYRASPFAFGLGNQSDGVADLSRSLRWHDMDVQTRLIEIKAPVGAVAGRSAEIDALLKVVTGPGSFQSLGAVSGNLPENNILIPSRLDVTRTATIVTRVAAETVLKSPHLAGQFHNQANPTVNTLVARQLSNSWLEAETTKTIVYPVFDLMMSRAENRGRAVLGFMTGRSDFSDAVRTALAQLRLEVEARPIADKIEGLLKASVTPTGFITEIEAMLVPSSKLSGVPRLPTRVEAFLRELVKPEFQAKAATDFNERLAKIQPSVEDIRASFRGIIEEAGRIDGIYTTLLGSEQGEGNHIGKILEALGKGGAASCDERQSARLGFGKGDDLLTVAMKSEFMRVLKADLLPMTHGSASGAEDFGTPPRSFRREDL